MFRVLLIIICFVGSIGCAQQSDYYKKRDAMITNQLITRGITNRATLDAMRRIPREHFVPENVKQYAYQDNPLPIGYRQTISQPYIVAFMTQELKLNPNDKVLEIGTGSGYQAAVLGEIVKEVYTIEIVEELGISAKKILKTLGYDNITVRIGDGYHGWKEHEPFEAIIVTAGIEKIPQPLLDQLADGGRMIIPVGPSNQRNLVLVTKKNGKIKKKKVLPVRFVPFVREKNGDQE